MHTFFCDILRLGGKGRCFMVRSLCHPSRRCLDGCEGLSGAELTAAYTACRNADHMRSGTAIVDRVTQVTVKMYRIKIYLATALSLLVKVWVC